MKKAVAFMILVLLFAGIAPMVFAVGELNQDYLAPAAHLVIENSDFKQDVFYCEEMPLVYMHIDSDGNQSPWGSLFFDERYEPQAGRNTVISAKDIRSISLLDGLKVLANTDFSAENHHIKLITEKSCDEYEVVYILRAAPVMVGHCDSFDILEQRSILEDDSFKRFIKGIEKLAVWHSGKEISKNDSFLTLTARREFSGSRGITLVAVRCHEE